MRKILFLIKANDGVKKDFIKEYPDFEFIFKTKEDVTIDDIKDASAIMGNLNVSLLNEAEKLEWLQLESAGADRYVTDGVVDKKVTITNATGAYGEAIAEHMIGQVFYFEKRFNEYVKNQENHIWKNMGMVDYVGNSKILVIGLGDIGKAFAKKMHLLGSKVFGIKKHVNQSYDYLEGLYTFDEIDKVISDCDIVISALPLTKETENIINYNLMKKMKKESILINVGRGKTLVTNDLIKLLDEGYFKGVGLDVFDQEPLDKESRLWNFPNVLITPHVSGNFNMEYTYEKVISIVKENLNHYQKNEPFINIVDRNSGYKMSNQ